jgi:N-acetylmuramoyl-L-alanine amidase
MSRLGILLSLALLLGACGGEPIAPSSSGPVPSAPAPSPTPAASNGLGQVIPAPGSESAVYAPNPAAIVVAIDPGHGGCLDWGSPSPFDNVKAKAEKTITLDIALALRDRLEAAGITVVMIRTTDEALAGDLYPPLGCEGASLRDVNGDGLAGFGPDFPPNTLARDELQARLDLANVAGADVLLSIHVDAITDAMASGMRARTAASTRTTCTWWPRRSSRRQRSGRIAGHSRPVAR